MTPRKIKDVLELMEEVKRRACTVLADAEQEDGLHFVTGTKGTGALRRASMDLTRALADMRR